LNNGKCVAAPGYEYIGRDRCGPRRKTGLKDVVVMVW